MTRVLAEEPGESRAWSIEATEVGLSFRCDGPGGSLEERFELARLPKQIHLNDGILFKGTLLARIGGQRRLLQLADDSVDALLRGLGRAGATAWLARTRTRYYIALGIFFLLSSVPIPANPEAGIEAIPPDYLGAGLGIGLLGLFAWARWAPRAGILFANAVWLGILSMAGIHDVFRGEAHPSWLLLSALLLPLALSALNSFNRLHRVFDGATPGDRV